jgi:hypothetical protein
LYHFLIKVNWFILLPGSGLEALYFGKILLIFVTSFGFVVIVDFIGTTIFFISPELLIIDILNLPLTTISDKIEVRNFTYSPIFK